VLVIAESTGRVLLGLRAPELNHGETWSVFGGQIERGEEPDEAASRELYEEAGLDYHERDFRLIHERKRKTGVYYTFAVMVRKEQRVRLNPESIDSGWFDLDDLPEPLHPGAEALFDEIDIEALIDEW
jgi:ADP-ribose pyrophosphatase YjhB (NUDIX family)